MFSDIFRGAKILVTGHTGFKGGWLSIWLEMMGAELIGCSLDPTNNRGIFLASGIGSRMTDKRIDIRRYEQLSDLLREEKVELVFHLAAQSLVLDSYNNPRDTFDTNVMGTANLLESIKDSDSVKAAVFVTSDKCYMNREWPWAYRENDQLGGSDPYSASKSAAEIIINSYRTSFFSGRGAPLIASVRAGNVIGGGDWSDNRIFPDIMKSIEDGDEIVLRNPDSIRPWQHVLEPLSGYLQLARRLMNNDKGFDEAWNFGPAAGELLSVSELVENVITKYGKGSWKVAGNDQAVKESSMLALDINKARLKLGWRPVLGFDKAVQMSCDWYKKQASGTDMLAYSQHQIEEFMELWNSGKEK